MLEPACLHRAAIADLYARALMQPASRFYQLASWRTWVAEIEDTDWSCIQRVSVAGDQVCGLLGARIDRDVRAVSSLEAVAFRGEGQASGLLFSRDLMRFLVGLVLDHGFMRVGWSVVLGNPAERLYDRVLPRLGGRVVGVMRQNIRLPDGSVTGQKFYEVLPHEWTHEQYVELRRLTAKRECM